MRNFSTDFSDHLESGITTLAYAWRMTRKDGAIIGLTDHDRALSFGGVRYEPGGAPDITAFTLTAGLQPGSADAKGAFAHDALSEEDLAQGLWSGARVDLISVNWQAPEQHIIVWSGYLSEITQSETGFEASLVSLKSDFERPIGRVYARACDAVLGDARCGIEKTLFPNLTCDHHFETCRNRFSNTENFRGFPHLPGPDAILQGPAATGNTGGKR